MEKKKTDLDWERDYKIKQLESQERIELAKLESIERTELARARAQEMQTQVMNALMQLLQNHGVGGGGAK